MIVFKADSIPELWNEALGLIDIDKDYRLKVIWGDREQNYFWANDIEYEYGEKRRKNIIVNVVVCYEFCVIVNKNSPKRGKIFPHFKKDKKLYVTEKNFFKNPVYNEPHPYDYMPVRPAYHTLVGIPFKQG